MVTDPKRALSPPSPISPASADRNLLLGMIALQNNFITREALVAGFDVWVRSKSKTLAEILQSAGALSADDREILERLVCTFADRHGGDTQKMLASLSSAGPVRLDLERLNDPELDASLGHIGPHQQNDLQLATTLPEFSGTSLGRFRILRPHGKGGLGQVSVALDQDLNREVALKEIQAHHADNRESRERFVQEAEITGGLEHPGIVPVYALGHGPDGRPFYAMRFVKGDSLKQAIEVYHRPGNPTRGNPGARQFALRQLLRRFVDVCNAVEYAHSRGVLHRDLKPGNIMVGKYGETLVVDWGLAKAVGRKEIISDETTLRPSSTISSSAQTRPGSALGTPAYMSPEQAAGRLEDIGTASDVYSLGATLYHLLCGKAPFAKKDFREILQQVQRGDFPKPRSVVREVPQPLEAICLKAMALIPLRRYQTPRSLADDLEHWLADEPVSAWREPLLDRIARKVRRHRTAFVGALALLLSGMVALVVIAALTQAQNERLREARDEAETNRRLAEHEGTRATQNLADARQLALNLLQVAESGLSQEPGKEAMRKQMTDRSLAVFQKFHAQQPEDAKVQWELTQVYRVSANLDRLTNNPTRALENYENAIGLLGELQRTMPSSEAQDYLAETLLDRAVLLQKSGRLRESSEDLARALDLAQKLRESSQNDVSYRRTEEKLKLQLADIEIELGATENALARLTRGIEVFRGLADGPESHPLDATYLVLVMNQQGELLRKMNRTEESKQVLNEALERARRKETASKERSSRHVLARTLLEYGRTLRAEDAVSETAGKYVEEAISVWSLLVNENKQTLDYQQYLGDALTTRAEMRLAARDIESARTDLESARNKLQAIADVSSKLAYHESLARCLMASARLEMNSGDRDQAVRLQQAAVRAQEFVVSKSPESTRSAAILESLRSALSQ